MEPTTAYAEAVTAEILTAIEAANTSSYAVSLGIGMTINTFKRRVNAHSFTVNEVGRIARHLNVPVEQLTAPRRAA